MKSAFQYRAYNVSNDGGFYVAKSTDGEPGQLVSKDLLRVLRSIDVLWDALETCNMPGWCATYLEGDTLHCDLDVFADSLSPNLESLRAHGSVDPLANVRKFFPDKAKPLLRIVAAA
ncbi:hypothetical protein [Bradyrhizobium ottawaense]|uniref:Uncharacterized protein n=1 Tax=Bradyrhizobium ottawaense TaxID=931866 RepID=A0ABY0QHJ6_9BRAD|nr:hypothetical protein [Bradyrhizobium ottawaense]SDK38812.1 hypothetical protein SAMN05444163_7994 [Bradyrhizobium ottawaense]SDK46819.1 hypothetical protein SAMN05444163_8187 [Bradyrhizobium ottawaense]